MTTCPRCGAPVLPGRDYTTGQSVHIDRDPVEGGPVEVKRPPLSHTGLVAIDHITRPAPRQPAFQMHARTCTNPAPPAPVDLDDDPVREQSGGWRR